VHDTFAVGLRTVVVNQRGVLARVAAAIAEENSNIVNIRMDDNDEQATSLYFTLQVHNRLHLAGILRRLRHIPEVVRIYRIKDRRHENDNA
jgi:(p)ppGpp synthase/HD superfamily hydrolase